MSESTKSQYLGYQMETVNGEARTPNKFPPQVENTLMKQIENISSESRQNVLNNTIYLAEGTPTITGDVNVEFDCVNCLPWFLLVLGGIASTDVSSGSDNSVYRHDITDVVCDFQSMTIESKRGGCTTTPGDQQNVMVDRAFGCVVDTTTLEVASNTMVMLNNSVMAQGAFDVAYLVANETPEQATTAVATIATASGVTTVTSTAHGRSAGDIVQVAGASASDYNGYYKVLTVPTANTLTIDYKGTETTSAGGTVKKVSQFFFKNRDVRGLVAGDTVKFYEDNGTWEDVVVRYVDNADDVLGFDSVTSTAFTLANNAKVELVAQTDTATPVDFVSFNQVKLRIGDTVADARTADPFSFETLSCEMVKNIDEKIQTNKNIVQPTGLDINITQDAAYENNELRDKWRNQDKMAMIVELDTGIVVSTTDTNNQTYKVNVIYPNVRYQTREIDDGQNQVIGESLVGIALHDFTEGYSMKVEVFNNQAGTYYTS